MVRTAVEAVHAAPQPPPPFDPRVALTVPSLQQAALVVARSFLRDAIKAVGRPG